VLINSKSLREQVYDFLRRELQRGKLVPGSSIDLNAISRQLGISKTPLRDALIQLEAEGFVTISPRRGIFVNRLSLDEIRHYYEVIGALEAAALSSVFHAIGPAELGEMRKLNLKLVEAIDRADFQPYYELNIAFHDVFLELSDNAALRQFIAPLKRRLYDFPRRGYIAEWERRNCQEHAQLIELIRAGDLGRALSLWKDAHWSYSYQEEYIRRFYYPAGPEEGAKGARRAAGARGRVRALPG
jgi:DNA-binding GntR family transcriptional regulator